MFQHLKQSCTFLEDWIQISKLWLRLFHHNWRRLYQLWERFSQIKKFETLISEILYRHSQSMLLHQTLDGIEKGRYVKSATNAVILQLPVTTGIMSLSIWCLRSIERDNKLRQRNRRTRQLRQKLMYSGIQILLLRNMSQVINGMYIFLNQFQTILYDSCGWFSGTRWRSRRLSIFLK